jgi:hypothetical protein
LILNSWKPASGATRSPAAHRAGEIEGAARSEQFILRAGLAPEGLQAVAVQFTNKTDHRRGGGPGYGRDALMLRAFAEAGISVFSRWWQNPGLRRSKRDFRLGGGETIHSDIQRVYPRGDNQFADFAETGGETDERAGKQRRAQTICGA